ncbi:MAG: SWIM zinc finger family protein [Cyanobacteria bacterium J06606_4]
MTALGEGAMALQWTAEQVLALSPNAIALKRGKALAHPSRWPVLGVQNQTLWGECQTYQKKPYRTIIDLRGPAFCCSCASGQLPCKHAIGLFLLLTEQPTTKQAPFECGKLPAWGAKWLESRAQAAMHTQDGKNQLADDPAAVAAQTQKRLQRLQKRSHNVEAGITDLEQWLQDIVRAGLAELPARPYQFWDSAAARLVDAQAPGLASRVRALAGIPHSGRGWPERMLKALGQLHLLVQAYRQIEALPLPLQAEVRTQVGFTQTKEALQQLADVPGSQVTSQEDTWQVLGKIVTAEDALKTQRVWLWGLQTQRMALVLSFAHGRRQSLDSSLVPGACVRGKLIFYPGTGVQRALVASRQAAEAQHRAGIGHGRIEAAIAQYASSLMENPWQTRYPLALSSIFLRYDSAQWWVQDVEGDRLPLSRTFTQGWELLSLSGGRSLSVFGEWDGTSLQPLSVWSEKKFLALQTPVRASMLSKSAASNGRRMR